MIVRKLALRLGCVNAFKKRRPTTYADGIEHRSAKMDDPMVARLKKIEWRKRTVMTSSCVNETENEIRSKCMDATMNLMRRLYVISDRNTYGDVCRGMLLIANSAPLRVMCVGISPYENGILPPFATALAYSPRKCIGVTPSVQVLSQIMSLCAMEIKDAYANKNTDSNVTRYLTRDEYTCKFAMMLRCSYSCVEAGVGFVNCSPVVTNMVSKACLSRSLFSEWIANMVMIHFQHGRKLSIVSMGSSANKTMDQAMGSYPGMSSCMNLVKTMNPAAIARMSVTKTECSSPIPNAITPAEMLIDSITGTSGGMDPKTGFHWTRYQDSTLKTLVGTDAVRHLVMRLVDHAPDRLANVTAHSIQKLIVIMSDYEIEAMMQNVGVNETAIANADEQHHSSTGNATYHHATVSGNTDVQQNVVINPFELANADASANTGTSANAYPNTSSHGSGNQNANQREGPPMYTKRSQLGQLLDPTGKAVSQQTIVIDSINKYADQIVMACRQISSDTVELTRRQTMLMDRMTKFDNVDDQDIEDAKAFVEEYTEHIKTVFEHMEESRGIIEGLHAVVEGDRGIYEPEATPVAPLLRRDDGTTMKQFVYGPTTRSGVVNQSASQLQPANTRPAADTNTGASALNPFEMGADSNVHAGTDSSLSLFDTGDDKFLEIAGKILTTSIRETDFGDGIKPKTVYNNMCKYEVAIGNTKTNLYKVLQRIVAQRITLNAGVNPSEDEIAALIGCLGSGSVEDLDECRDPFVDAVMNDTAVMDLFTTLATAENEDELGTETEDSDESDDDDE